MLGFREIILKHEHRKVPVIGLVGVAQWTECQPVNQKVASSIPSQGTCLDCRPGLQLGACERQPIDVSFTTNQLMFLSLLKKKKKAPVIDRLAPMSFKDATCHLPAHPL